jgi:glycosyltransferase involved in cell wall biosynthesis
MKRLLAISWEMPPMYGPRASQVAATVSQLAARGWVPSVVCMDPRRGGPHWRDGVDAEPLDGVDLIRVPSPEESIGWRVASRLVPLLRRWPDGQRVWTGGAVAAARRTMASRSFAGMVTFGQPWSDHVAGLTLHRSERLPWVAHFSDPWVDSPYWRVPGWQRRIVTRMERDVIAEADAVVFVTAETADLVMRKYPEAWRKKATVVPHGFVASRQPVASSVAARRPGPMRLVYTGRFYSGLRTPSALLRAIAALHARTPLAGVLDVEFIGPRVDEFRGEADALGLGSIVRFGGPRPKAEAARAAADADVLLVIEAASDGPSVFLPSKLVDYLAFRKPIFALTPAAGASARLLARLECPVAPPDDVDAIAAAVATLVDRWRAGSLCLSSAFDAVAAEFDIRRTTAQFDDVLARAFRPAGDGRVLSRN